MNGIKILLDKHGCELQFIFTPFTMNGWNGLKTDSTFGIVGGANGTYSVDNTAIAIGGGICGIKGPWTDQTIIASQLLVQRAFLSVSDTQCELSSQTYSLKIWPAVDLGNTDKVKIKFPANTFPPLNSNVKAEDQYGSLASTFMLSTILEVDLGIVYQDHHP